MEKAMSILIFLTIILVSGCTTLGDYTPLQEGNLNFKAGWVGGNQLCEGYNAVDNISTYLTVNYPSDIPADSRSVNCKYEMDGKESHSYSDIADKEVIKYGQSQLESHTIRICCYGAWETDRAYDACVTKKIEGRC